MVEISIVLMKIVTINEVEHNIEFQFSAELRWRENRAKFHNLKTDTSLNSLSDKEMEQLWLPLVIYDNTDQKESTRLSAKEADTQWVTTVTVTKEGNFTRCLTDFDCEGIPEKQSIVWLFIIFSIDIFLMKLI